MMRLFFKDTKKIGSASMFCQCANVKGDLMPKNP